MSIPAFHRRSYCYHFQMFAFDSMLSDITPAPPGLFLLAFACFIFAYPFLFNPSLLDIDVSFICQHVKNHVRICEYSDEHTRHMSALPDTTFSGDSRRESRHHSTPRNQHAVWHRRREEYIHIDHMNLLFKNQLLRS